MPPSGRRQTYFIDDDWRDRVRARLEELEWSQAELARRVGCSPAMITLLLSGQRSDSPLVWDIHVALGWSPPRSPFVAAEDEELWDIWQKMKAGGYERERQRWLERGRGLLEDRESEDQRRSERDTPAERPVAPPPSAEHPTERTTSPDRPKRK